MDALVLWRNSSLQKRASGDTLRPVSPPPPLSETSVTDLQREEQQFIDDRSTREDHKYHGRSKSEPPSELEKRQAAEDDKKATMDLTGHNQGQGSVKKPTSSSWVQWWSRSRQTKVLASGNAQVLDPVRFLPPKDPFSLTVFPQARDSSTASLPLPPKQQPPLDEKSKASPSNLVKTSSAPSTPVQLAADAPQLPEQETTPTRPAAPPAKPAPNKRFAKTLRLTSDQLVCCIILVCYLELIDFSCSEIS
jgi:phosphatidate phosphatase LPIN